MAESNDNLGVHQVYRRTGKMPDTKQAGGGATTKQAYKKGGAVKASTAKTYKSGGKCW